MGAFRKSLPCVSLLLLAVLVPVQAAGCCKWSALLAWEGPAEKRVAAAQDVSGGMAAGHACCRKQAPPGETSPSAPASADSAPGDPGCCLEGVRAGDPALASVPAASADGAVPSLLLPSGESPRVTPLLPSRSTPRVTGPPPYLAHLRLLI